MFLLLVLTAASICFTVSGQSGTKQRVASLVVLPPLVIGYDELYRDSTETKKLSPLKTGEPEISTPPKKKATAAPVIKKGTVAPVINNKTAAPVVKNKTAAPVVKNKTRSTVKNIKPDATSTKKKQPVAVAVKTIKPGTLKPKKKKKAAVTASKSKKKNRAAVKEHKKAKKNKPGKAPAKKNSTKKNSAHASGKKKRKGTRENAQRSVMIDTKGRRGFRSNYRSILKKLRKNLNQQDNFFEDNIINNDMTRALQQGPM